jgi:hypothetical protein
MKVFIEIFIVATITLAVGRFLGNSDDSVLLATVCAVGFYAARNKG